MELNEKELERILAFCRKKEDFYNDLLSCSNDELLLGFVTGSTTLQDVKNKFEDEHLIYFDLNKKLEKYKKEKINK